VLAKGEITSLSGAEDRSRVKTFSCSSSLWRLIYPEMNPVPAITFEAELLVTGQGNSLRRAAATGFRLDSFQSKPSLTA